MLVSLPIKLCTVSCYGILTGINLTIAVGNYWSLGIDWVTGTLYTVTDGGYIIACDGRSESTGGIHCFWLVNDQGELRGITLRPDAGYVIA